ncbi:MAG: hypothetical protein AAFV49_08190 [Pseudomonadota bacterium]
MIAALPREAAPPLRALARDRAADEVARDEENGSWEDWLDMQTAAIEALGAMGVANAVPDMLVARADEMDQALAKVVFPVLARVGASGVAALFGLMRTR